MSQNLNFIAIGDTRSRARAPIQSTAAPGVAFLNV